ncbi:MAG: Chromosome partition protein Smc [candidate division WS2 bacterium]|nr:Chromosome partition protein Smc [Candidatus Lithacetigena glycinireducens]
MGVKRISVTNFKSFERLEIELGKFNVLIGANASGKSNFVQIFRFLRDIENFGLNNAVSMQGGVEYLRNINICTSEDFSLKVVSDQEFKFLRRRTKEGLIGIKIDETTYEFALKFKKRGLGFEIAKDNLTLKCKFVRVERQKRKIEEKEEIGQGEIILFRANGKVKLDLHKPEQISIKEDDIYPPFLREQKLLPNILLLETPFFFIPPLEEIFSEISVYDFDPKLPKKATPITGKVELEEDGSNLATILRNITENKEGRRRLFNLVKDLLPFISNLDVEKFADKSLLFKLQEKYFKNQYLPASLISDGTINITALIVALYFEKKPLTIIEEPERNIHPYLISKVVDMMKDASQKKQIIVTTHNPEIVKHAGLDNILLVSRDEKGFSTVSRPVDKEEVKTFLQNEIGVEELYVQNLLGV